MIIPLYPLLNPLNLPNGLRFGQHITVDNHRTAHIQRAMSDGRIRLLVDCKLGWPVPQYVTFAQLAAYSAPVALELAAVA